MSIAAGPSCSRASSSEPVTQLDPCSVSSESVQLGSVWQRLADDRWIVGLAVHNGTSRLVPLLLSGTRNLEVGYCSKTRRSRCSQECKDPHRHFTVPRNLDLWPFDPKINGFQGLVVDHFCVKFGDPSCSGFWDHVERQTDKRYWKPDPLDYCKYTIVYTFNCSKCWPWGSPLKWY